MTVCDAWVVEMGVGVGAGGSGCGVGETAAERERRVDMYRGEERM